MTTKIVVSCLGCKARLNIPVQHCGKKVACPKCQTQFRVPMMKDNETPVSSAVATLAPPVEDDPFAGFSDLNASTPVQPSYTYPSQAAPPTKTKPTNKRKSGSKKEPELSESDEKLQGSGFFLLCLPVLASALPLMGLQIRRLAALGEFAPLAAMFLAFIGAGMIAYARRNRSDAGIFAGGAALFSLVVGIGGFFLLLYMPVEDSADTTNNNLASAGNSNRITPSPMVSSGNRPTQPNHARPPHSPTSRTQPGFTTRNQTASGRPPTNQATSSDPFTEEDKGEHPGPGSHDFSNSASGPTSDSSEANPFADSSEANPFADASGGIPNNHFSGPANEHGLPNASSNMEFIKQNGQAKIDFLKAFPRSTRRKATHTLKNQVGKTENFGCLYANDKVESIGIFDHHGDLLIMPLSSNRKAGSGEDNVVRPGEGELLAGLRFAFSDEKIVGVQGLIKKINADAVTPTKWIGTETEDIQESLNPNPNEARMVVFQKGNTPVGFAWGIKDNGK